MRGEEKTKEPKREKKRERERERKGARSDETSGNAASLFRRSHLCAFPDCKRAANSRDRGRKARERQREGEIWSVGKTDTKGNASSLFRRSLRRHLRHTERLCTDIDHFKSAIVQYARDRRFSAGAKNHRRAKEKERITIHYPSTRRSPLAAKAVSSLLHSHSCRQRTQRVQAAKGAKAAEARVRRGVWGKWPPVVWSRPLAANPAPAPRVLWRGTLHTPDLKPGACNRSGTRETQRGAGNGSRRLFSRSLKGVNVCARHGGASTVRGPSHRAAFGCTSAQSRRRAAWPRPRSGRRPWAGSPAAWWRAA